MVCYNSSNPSMTKAHMKSAWLAEHSDATPILLTSLCSQTLLPTVHPPQQLQSFLKRKEKPRHKTLACAYKSRVPLPYTISCLSIQSWPLCQLTDKNCISFIKNMRKQIQRSEISCRKLSIQKTVK